MHLKFKCYVFYTLAALQIVITCLFKICRELTGLLKFTNKTLEVVSLWKSP